MQLQNSHGENVIVALELEVVKIHTYIHGSSALKNSFLFCFVGDVW